MLSPCTALRARNAAVQLRCLDCSAKLRHDECRTNWSWPSHVAASVFQDPPCTLNWGDMVPNSRYLGPNRG